MSENAEFEMAVNIALALRHTKLAKEWASHIPAIHRAETELMRAWEGCSEENRRLAEMQIA